MKQGKFKSDLSKICSKDELRPALCLVHFSNGYAYATNGYALVRQSLSWMEFDEDEIKVLNNKSLTAEAFKLAKKALFIEVKEDCLIAILKNSTVSIEYADTSLKFPDVESVINKLLKSEKKEIKHIGINPSVLFSLFSAMDFYSTAQLDFYGEAKGILVTDTTIDSQDQIGLVMPVMLNN